MESENESFQEIISRIGRGLDTHAVFGEPLQVDGSSVIPVAKVRYGGGGGTGSGSGEGRPGEGAGELGSGEGMGMGFGVSAEPLGVVRVAHDDIQWIPIVDRTRLAVIWSVVSGLLLIMVARRLFSHR